MLRLYIGAMLLASVLGLHAQQGTTSKSESEVNASEREAPAANAWMFVPTSVSQGTSVSSLVRAQRDSYWDQLIGMREPLTTTKLVMGVSEGVWTADEPALPKAPNRAILTATFATHHSVLSASERCIYTEVNLHVEKVYQVEAGGAGPGQDITLTLPGGTVVAASGKVISHLRQSRRLFIQPGRKYLMVLAYEAAGDFYKLLDDWDITDGKVHVNSIRDDVVPRPGHPTLDGLTVSEVEPVIYRLLSAETH